MENMKKILQEILEDRKKKVWSEELRKKYSEFMLCPRAVDSAPRFKCTCKVCGQQFEAKSSKEKYCCDECKDISFILKGEKE